MHIKSGLEHVINSTIRRHFNKLDFYYFRKKLKPVTVSLDGLGFRCLGSGSGSKGLISRVFERCSSGFKEVPSGFGKFKGLKPEEFVYAIVYQPFLPV